MEKQSLLDELQDLRHQIEAEKRVSKCELHFFGFSFYPDTLLFDNDIYYLARLAFSKSIV